MPHIIVKLWPGKSEAQKRDLAERIYPRLVEKLRREPIEGVRRTHPRRCSTTWNVLEQHSCERNALRE